MLCVGLVIAFEVRKRPVIIVWGMILTKLWLELSNNNQEGMIRCHNLRKKTGGYHQILQG